MESSERTRLIATLAQAGCIAPDEEADALIEASARGAGTLEELVTRRLSGEPLAWVTGSVIFCGVPIQVTRGVFVPRPHTELLARRATSLLPAGGVAIDLCTGSGAVAAAVGLARPTATVLATDIDPEAVACARRNGVQALLGNLDEPLSPALLGRVDVITAVAPYVPHNELHLLPRDVLAYEPPQALDGGERGTSVLLQVARAAPRWLAPHGSVLLELGGDQAKEMSLVLADLGLSDSCVRRDRNGQDRVIEARRPKAS